MYHEFRSIKTTHDETIVIKKEKNNLLNIFLIGEYSTGKSSFLNAISGSIVSNTSLQRETSNIDLFKFRSISTMDDLKNIALSLSQTHLTNINKRNGNMKYDNLSLISEYNIPSTITFENINVYDFPGVTDH